MILSKVVTSMKSLSALLKTYCLGYKVTNRLHLKTIYRYLKYYTCNLVTCTTRAHVIAKKKYVWLCFFQVTKRFFATNPESTAIKICNLNQVTNWVTLSGGGLQ